MDPQSLINNTTLVPRPHRARPHRMILGTEAIPRKSLNIAFIKLIEPRRKHKPSVLEMIRERRCPRDLL